MAGPIRSMTGYAAARRETAAGELSVSLRTVNHRGLDLHFHHSSDFTPLEKNMRDILKQHIVRGHVEVRTSLQRSSAGEFSIDRLTLARYVAAFREASQQLGASSPPDVNVFLQLPGVLARIENSEESELGDAFTADLTHVLSACATELNAVREREGAALAAHILAENAGVEEKTLEIAALRRDATVQLQNRLQERLKDLLGTSNLSATRLAEEAALLADRSDVEEEITRLTVHAADLRRLIEAGGEVGKRLDFLLQEMNRETNTILSKTSGLGQVGLKITGLGLAIKAHIEKTKEQALNLE